MKLNDLKREIRKQADPQRAKSSLWFFKTGKGEYGEGDKFLGLTVPAQRKIAVQFSADLCLSELQKLLKSKFHEERLIALFILVLKFEEASSFANPPAGEAGATEDQVKIYDFYLENTKYINNWDLVDSSAHKIVGAYLENKDRKILYKLARSKDLWERRIATISTFHFIGEKQYEDSLAIAEILLHDKHDLIHKAVGWMLREIGKNCGEKIEEKFLRKHYKTMPRTMLRYAIERFPEKKRKFYLK
jgi:3-methyladenine DNA glycosylase AlkD